MTITLCRYGMLLMSCTNCAGTTYTVYNVWQLMLDTYVVRGLLLLSHGN